MAEIRSGKREGSVVSTATFDTAARNSRETWESLHRELEDIGISPSVIIEKRQYIVTWFQKAVAMGKLEEAAPSDDNDSAISLCESNDLARTSDCDDVFEQHNPSVMPEPRSTVGSGSKGSMPRSQRSAELTTPPLLPAPKEPEPGKVCSTFQFFSSREGVLREAAIVGDIPLLQKLLDEGIDVNARDELGFTALHRAAEEGRKHVLLILLESGADIGLETSSSGSTALFYATTKRIVRTLLEKGADLNFTSKYGITPLIKATKENRETLVRYLLDNGAMISAVDHGGKTALDWAQARHYKAIVRLLQRAEGQRHHTGKSSWQFLEWRQSRRSHKRRMPYTSTGLASGPRIQC